MPDLRQSQYLTLRIVWTFDIKIEVYILMIYKKGSWESGDKTNLWDNLKRKIYGPTCPTSKATTMGGGNIIESSSFGQ